MMPHTDIATQALVVGLKASGKTNKEITELM